MSTNVQVDDTDLALILDLLLAELDAWDDDPPTYKWDVCEAENCRFLRDHVMWMQDHAETELDLGRTSEAQISRYVAQELDRWRAGATITTDDDARRLYRLWQALNDGEEWDTVEALLAEYRSDSQTAPAREAVRRDPDGDPRSRWDALADTWNIAPLRGRNVKEAALAYA